MTITRPLTWETIVHLEPRLTDIVRRIETIKDRHAERTGTRRLCPNAGRDLWYGLGGSTAIRAQLNALIGCGSRSPHEDLRGSAAHDLCYHYLFDLLLAG